ILAHSMGGAIATLFLQRHRVRCDAIALTAPMFGIVIRLPSFVIRHIVPNVLGVVVVYASLLVPSMILFESFLSFLGLGTQEP
ncbi:alpha/beta hydrolase, partial [Salmonella enterica subsp. enterica serovar Kentucky]|nr:alpha/beta hydrolase [Salmonella enterica subsp. enterica serovar Kentucky]